MTTHIRLENGAAKCGANVYNHYEDRDGKWTFIEKRIARRFLLSFADAEHPATCKRCLNTMQRAEVVAPTEDLTGKVFHRSFGYDMTINVWAKPIKQTEKGYICQELNSNLSGEPFHPGATGRSSAGKNFKEGSKPFVMLFKRRNGYGYWSGGGHHWSVESEGAEHYENRCD